MNNQLDEIVDELQMISEKASETFGNLSKEQINWRPSETGWSIGQCLDHLIKSNDEFKPTFEKLKAGERKNSFWEKYSPLTGFFGNFLLNSLKNDAKKFKTPSKAIVPPGDIAADIVERFAKHQAEVIETVKSLEKIDMEKTVITSPFLKLMTYRLGKAYEIAVEHEKRHIRQAERVLQRDDFPK